MLIGEPQKTDDTGERRGPCTIDTAFGSPSRRNNVVTIDQLIIPRDTPDCYTSMYHFGEEYAQLCNDTGSVKGASKLQCDCDFLWFDIDSLDLTEALVDARQLVVNTESIDSSVSESLAIYFSGSKGFHIGLPAGLFGWESSVSLPRVHKVLAKMIAKDVEIDTAIYEHNRLWRVPNTQHSKSGLYKVPLTHDQLATWSVDQIREFAGSPTADPEMTQAKPGVSSNGAFTEMYQQAVEAVSRKGNRKAKSSVSNQSVAYTDKPCYQMLLSGVGAGKRNEAALRLAVAVKSAGKPQDEVYRFIWDWNQRNDTPLEDTELETVIKSAWDGDYDYGCNDRFLKELCDDSCPLHKNSAKSSPDKPKYDSFVTLSDGSLAELVVGSSGSRFAIYDPSSDGYDGCDGFMEELPGGILPYPTEYLDKIKVVRFPSHPEPYDSDRLLRSEIDTFVRRYLSVSEFFHLIIPYYVQLTWLYDRFSELPYLRAIGDYGSGKSRFIETVGAVCYKPMITMGVASISALFRILDMFKGTLVIDEADFGHSDESGDIVKMLNTGYQKNFPLLKSEPTKRGMWQPASFDVFGPKLIATRKEFNDEALESRCLTEHMDGKVRPGILVNLPDAFWDEALDLRNKLLTYRLRNYYKVQLPSAITSSDIHPRVAQIMQPLLSIIDDQDDREKIQQFMVEHDKNLKEARSETAEGRVIKAILDLRPNAVDGQLSINQITERVNEQLGDNPYKFSNQKVGLIVSRRLNLPRNRTGQSRNVDVSSQEAVTKIKYWCDRFAMEWPE